MERSNNNRTAKTLAERFGFLDQDLKNPKHDDIMVWLHSEIENIMAGIYGSRVWSFEYVRQCRKQNMPDPPAYEYSIKNILWEVPVIKDNSSYIVGFADLKVSVQRSDALYAQERERLQERLADGSFKTIREHGYEWDYSLETDEHIFEVKTSIPSVGELIRQINMYRSYWPKAHFYVVAPECKHESILQHQDITFIQYKERNSSNEIGE